MFYFDGIWKPYEKKVTYTQTVTEYDNDVTRFPVGATITGNDLTDEELARLEAVKRTNISLDELIEYVKTGNATGEAVEADKADRQRKAFLNAIDLTTVDPQILMESNLSREWEPDGWMEGLITHLGILYKVIQPHKSQADWTPDKTPALFAPFLTSPAGPLPWVQPDSTNPYMIGDRVTFNGKTYESLIDNNVWSPEAYPAGWVEVTL